MSISYRAIGANELDAGLIAAWRSIQHSSAGLASPYFCPEFTQLVHSVRHDVRLVVIENGGRPVGFFPYQRSFLGLGRPVGGPLSDYHGVIADPHAEWSVPELMRAAKLSAWTFDHLVDEAAKFAPYISMHASSPRIDLRASRGSYPDFARKARKLARDMGDLRLSLHQPQSRALERLIEWKSKQYRRTRLADAFAVRWTNELVRTIMHVQTAEFAGVFSVLRAGDRIVALHAGMRSRQVLHWWFPSYDENFARYSPGIILLLRLAEAAAQAGLRALDLGKGDARYKRSVMTGAAPLAEGCVEMPSLVAKVRRLRRAAEQRAGRGGVAATLWLPLRAIRRIERARTFH